jgi:Ca2+-binding RTX toxin-like protein
LFLVTASGGVLLVRAVARADRPVDQETRARSTLEDLPLNFIENRGQVPGEIDYYLHGADASVGFSSDGLLVSLPDRAGTTRRSLLGLDFVGTDGAEPTGLSEAQTVVSYFKGDQENWVTGVPTYERVAYRDLWPGIDLVYSGTGGRLKYSFMVEPGADTSDIRVAVSGAAGLEVNAAGQLEVATPAGKVVDDTPYTYQMIDGRRVEVPSAYVVTGDRYRFDLGAYDPARALVIDPVMLIYAGYIGGAGGVADSEQAYGVAVDSTGAAYVTGITDSTETTFPDGDGFGALSGPDTSFNGVADAFVAKVASSGTSLVYVGYIGGASLDTGNDIAVDSAGAAYVTGYTESHQSSFPVSGGPDLTQNGSADAFVAKVASSGTSLDYAGYIGGSGIDAGHGIDVDSGAAYVTGETASTQTTFPDGNGFGTVSGPDTLHNGGTDGFVAKVASSGTSLDYAGYIGGSGHDFGVGIAADSTGAAYVTGQTPSTETTFPDGDPDSNDTFPVSGFDTAHNGGVDGFVAKVASTGTSLSNAGYIGGTGTDAGYGVEVDSTGAAYVTGETASTATTFPDGDGFGTVSGPDTTHNDASDAFVAKVGSSGTSLSYAGYIGGSGADVGSGIAVDSTGAAFVAGTTSSAGTSFPDGDGFGTVTGPDITHNGGDDTFVSKVAPAGTSLDYAGYIGGSGTDTGNDIAVDSTGAAYLAGHTVSTEISFPDGDDNMNDAFEVPGPDTTHNGSATSDGFVAKVAITHTLTVTKDGTGSGTVTSSPAGIDCGSDCTESYSEGTDVNLTAAAASGSTFAGWTGGGCGGTGACMLTMDANKAVTATFSLVPTSPLAPGPTPAAGATCLGATPTLVGTSGDDSLTGTNGADVLVGLGGNDTVAVLGGNDLVCAGEGNDTVNGGGGKDKVFGEEDNDRLKGAGGNDKLNGGPEKDKCIGGPGRDRGPGCEKKKSIP